MRYTQTARTGFIGRRLMAGVLSALTLAAALVGVPGADAKGSSPVSNLNEMVSSDGKAVRTAETNGMRDGFASAFGSAARGPSTDSIIGADNRYWIANTTTYPRRATVLITFSGGRCTGFLIGPNTVATAGHCVAAKKKWYTNYRIYPAYTGAPTYTAPYGSCGARTLYTVKGWFNSGKTDYDYGAIKLDCNIGNTVGWYGMRWQSASLNGQTAIITGYPGDKPYQMWEGVNVVSKSAARKISYATDTMPGQSGAPVYNLNATYGWAAIAVHTNGGAKLNAGTRITKDVFANYMAWRAA